MHGSQSQISFPEVHPYKVPTLKSANVIGLQLRVIEILSYLHGDAITI